MRVVIAAILLIMPVAGQAPAYKAPRTADGKPNLNGIWQVLNTANWDLQGQRRASRPGGGNGRHRRGPSGPGSG